MPLNDNIQLKPRGFVTVTPSFYRYNYIKKQIIVTMTVLLKYMIHKVLFDLAVGLEPRHGIISPEIMFPLQANRSTKTNSQILIRYCL